MAYLGLRDGLFVHPHGSCGGPRPASGVWATRRMVGHGAERDDRGKEGTRGLYSRFPSLFPSPSTPSIGRKQRSAGNPLTWPCHRSCGRPEACWHGALLSALRQSRSILLDFSDRIFQGCPARPDVLHSVFPPSKFPESGDQSSTVLIRLLRGKDRFPIQPFCSHDTSPQLAAAMEDASPLGDYATCLLTPHRRCFQRARGWWPASPYTRQPIITGRALLLCRNLVAI